MVICASIGCLTASLSIKNSVHHFTAIKVLYPLAIEVKETGIIMMRISGQQTFVKKYHLANW